MNRKEPQRFIIAGEEDGKNGSIQKRGRNSSVIVIKKPAPPSPPPPPKAKSK
jgi:hypothetical protein